MAKPKEGDITIKEGNRFVYRNGKWYPEGKGEFGSQANTREANRALRELRQSKPIGYAARKKAERENAKEPPKKSNLRGVSSTNDIASLRRGQEEARQNQLSKANRTTETPKPAKVTDKPRAIPRSQAPASSSSKPARSSSGSSSKAAKASETYRDGGKGLYQGTKEYRDKVGGSGNPLLNRFRSDMGRDTATGNKVSQQQTQPKPATSKQAPETKTNTSQSSKSAFESNRSSIENDTKAKPFDASRFTQEKPKVDNGKTPGDLAKALREKRERERNRNRNIG